MKDRLIGLIEKEIDTKQSGINAEWLADYLLENGVIVPPCKVGDKVYVTDMYENISVVTECTVLGYDAIDENGVGIMEYKPCEDVPYISSVSCFVDDIGKTVFLTREEAEKALQGVKG